MSSHSSSNTFSSGLPQPTETVRSESPVSLSTIGLKDHRAFDLERQRTMKGAEHLKAQLRKDQQSSWTRALSMRMAGSAPSRAKSPRKNLVSAVGLNLSFTQSGTSAEQLHDSVHASSPSSPRTPVASSLDGRPQSSSEVQLADLISVRPQRKGRQPRDGDFEVIPKVRPVIALDDHVAQDYEPMFDEPWDMINTPLSGSEAGEPADMTFQAPSYASVLATGI